MIFVPSLLHRPERSGLFFIILEMIAFALPLHIVECASSLGLVFR